MTANKASGRRSPKGGVGASTGLVGAVLTRPRLWSEAVRALVAMAPAGWWRRRPFVPVPDTAYLEWRTATAYGRSDAPLDPDDLVAYLAWRKTFRRAVAR